MSYFQFWIVSCALTTWTIGQQYPNATFWATRKPPSCPSKRIFSKLDEASDFGCADIKTTKFVACIREKCKDGRESFVAAAAIISRYWTITAAHPLTLVPIKNIKLGRLFVYSNTAIWDQLGIKHKVDKVCIHRNFTRSKKTNLDYDVAVVRVRQPFRGKYEKPIRNPKQTYEYKEKSVATVLGWGSVYWDSEILRDDKLKRKNTTLVEYFNCQKMFGNTTSTVPYRMFCAAVAYDPCIYDPGSPIFQNDILIGVASWTIAHCAGSATPMLFTRLSLFNQWIEYKLGMSKKRGKKVPTQSWL